MFCHMKEKLVSSNSSLLDDLPPSPKINMEDVLNCKDSSDFDWISHQDSSQRYVKVEFTAPMSPNMRQVEPYVSNESSISDYYRFAQAVLSFAHMEGLDADFDLGIEQVESSSSNGLRVCFLYADNALWHQVMKTKDFQPELLRWYL